ncbi:NAD(P)/FAD-dependent oxidoreductase [Parvularcula marina]|uniref:NAD(P)/FAD-dependent oxidoreductase n=1 Tax=Parvularcula marina TaxID=2292771 RepID=UPI003519560B
MSFDTDVLIVGAGAVGLSCGYALARLGREVLVIEKGPLIGEGISSRNSEVIHGGLYYPTGSLKARLCVEGRRMLYDFLRTHHVPFQKCGKLVVATEADEEERLAGIMAQAEANGVEGMVALGGRQARSLEPHLRASAALLSPESGVMDSHTYMQSLEGRIADAGGQVVLNTEFLGASPLPQGGFEVRTGPEEMTLTTRALVIAAGLGAQKAATGIEDYPQADIPALHYGKGVYFALSGKAPFRHLVYPLPIPGALGTHYRRDLGGVARFGPDLRFVEAPEYSVEETRVGSFYETIRRFWPDIPDGALMPDYAGVRPKLHGPGEPQPDFRIDGPDAHGIEGLVTLFGIESPGLTSSLAIGEEVACILEAS